MRHPDLQAEPTLANYKAYLKNEFGNQTEADEFFRLYPVASDAEVHDAFAHFDTNYAFGYPAHRFAWNAVRSGQKVWYYYFTYAGRSEAGSPEVDWFAAERALCESLVATGLVSPSASNQQDMQHEIYH
jgi:hypothetical protein